ncbi:Holliday junction resolvase RuvX [Buchnera aphidicola (Thelaxes californica)]|uniref:Putative pre-16S rRNA nuclease n=1 Tax=Buchnera aphidicola (Thelaxes californica) TaxID=1315998 RepID=A0A4D6YMG4_9GAMM|nr:Holliday junction resolvase RuvX [Buchnera aphidicola]QCI26948.1 Holliday junction resolvase RuvX [Buchnera aphidicola (Thelaxes californica)]
MSLVIAFDFGTKKIGVAVGQNITKTARILPSIPAIQGFPNWEFIQKILIQWKPKCIVIGLPLDNQGEIQKITKKTQMFSIIMKKKFHIPIYLHDERFTTTSIKCNLFQEGGFKKLKKNNVDSLCAVLILESWFYQTNLYI